MMKLPVIDAAIAGETGVIRPRSILGNPRHQISTWLHPNIPQTAPIAQWSLVYQGLRVGRRGLNPEIHTEIIGFKITRVRAKANKRTALDVGGPWVETFGMISENSSPLSQGR